MKEKGLLSFINIFLTVDFNSSNCQESQMFNWDSPSEDKFPIFELNVKDHYRFLQKKIVSSNILITLSSKVKKESIDSNTLLLDTDSYTFAIDTGTSESVYRNRELFVGDMQPCKNVSIQSVGGKIPVEGVGTIKIRVIDDNGSTHELLIHNVLYVPTCPINLLSPQRWSKHSGDVLGTGEITQGDTTILFWNNAKCTRLVPHHPELGIPIMTSNDGYTKSTAFLQALNQDDLWMPCMTQSYTSTSQPLDAPSNSPTDVPTVGNPCEDEIYIMPMDDEDIIVERLASKSPLLVDELDIRSKHHLLFIHLM